MKNIHYIRATSDHLALLVQSRIEFMQDYWGKQEEAVEQTLRDELTTFFEREMKTGNYLAWFAFNEQSYVAVGGMMVMQRPGSFRIPDGRSGYIMNMYTIPSYRKQGIGKQIIERLIQSGTGLGIKLFDLHATKIGEPLYINTGFIKHEEPTYRKYIL
jgi:GNAT superfamily N-acetyltransferase